MIFDVQYRETCNIIRASKDTTNGQSKMSHRLTAPRQEGLAYVYSFDDELWRDPVLRLVWPWLPTPLQLRLAQHQIKPLRAHMQIKYHFLNTK